jgi:glycolate oxidase iron-sulfur subunit
MSKESDMTDNNRDLLKEVQDIVTQCDRCGTCLTVCPLFGVKDVEASSARGKNILARAVVEGGFAPDGRVLEKMNFCLLCRTCIDNCPSKVKTDEAMIALRQYITDRAGGPNAKYRALGAMMKRKNLVKFSAGALGAVRRLGLGGLVPFGMAPSPMSRAQYLACFAGPAALAGPAPAAAAAVAANAKVAYFQGCGMRMMFPGAVAETRKILGAVTTPTAIDNVCCGLPHLAHGQWGDFLALARENIALYAGADIIVSDCASCAGTLKHIGAYLAADPEWRQAAEAFSAKIMSLSEYLVKAGYQPRQCSTAKITFHEPCHLGRGQGVKKEPRQLLSAAGDFVEMAGADTCCGGAGSFHTDYPEVAAAILDKKQANIEKSGADIVVSECPVCLVQLSKAAGKSGGKFKVMHISQVL